MFLNFNEDTFELKAKIQKGAIKENGVNGCQIDDVIAFSREFISKLNEKFPCRENALVITKLQEAELWLLARKIERENRKVEGTEQK